MLAPVQANLAQCNSAGLYAAGDPRGICWNAAPQSVQCAGTRQRMPPGHAPGAHRLYLRSPWPHGIVPQAVMALHVFVAQAYRVDSLPKHRLQGELDLAGSRWPVKQAAKRPKTSNVWSASRSSSDPVSGDIGSPSNVPTTCATAPSPRNEALPYDHFAPLQRKGWL